MKKNKAIRIAATLAASIWLLIACAGSQVSMEEAPATVNPGEEVNRFDNEISNAQKDQLNDLATSSFDEDDGYLMDAKKALGSGDKLSQIMEMIALGRTQLQHAEEIAQVARTTLPDVIKARELARAAGATSLDEDYAKAEEQFLKLTKAIENNDLKYAQNNREKVASVFDQLELRTIQEQTLGEARRLIKQAEKSILNILLNSQIDVSQQTFMDCTGLSPDFCKSFKESLCEDRDKLLDPITGKQAVINGEKPFIAPYGKLKFNELNLRKQKYKNYNFSNCSFLSVNLYSADFSSCTLKNNLFVDVDLQEASFSDSNLSGSIFMRSNLQKTDFRESRLRDVVFVNPILNRRDAVDEIEKFCKENIYCELEGARFSLGSLLWTAGPPFDIFDREKSKGISEGLREEQRKLYEKLREEQAKLYINLLMYHRQSIDDMVKAANEGDKKEKEKLEKLIKNTDTGSQEELIQRMEEAEMKTKILATPATAHKYTFFSKR